MNNIACTGLDGSIPLHFLASLGALRIIQRTDTMVKMKWDLLDGIYSPVYISMLKDIDKLSLICSNWLMTLAGEISSSKKKNIIKELFGKKKEAKTTAKEEAKEKALKGKAASEYIKNRIVHITNELVAHQNELDQIKQNSAITMGDGIAHLGDYLKEVSVKDFRDLSERQCNKYILFKKGITDKPSKEDSYFIVSQLSALASDAIEDIDGNIIPTPFSFSNNCSGKRLLKDFRSCAERSTKEKVLASLLGSKDAWVKEPGVSSLSWSPSDIRDYALRWGDPGTDKEAVDVATNALAYLGLACMTVVPIKNSISTIGWKDGKKNQGFRWYLWKHAVDVETIKSLLHTSATIEELNTRGVEIIYFSEAYNPNGKRNYFSPSQKM